MTIEEKLPSALVIGAPKAGTTTLCAALQRHPSIFMYPKKETHFFNHHYERRGIDWYSGLFRDAPDGALIMEGTPDYCMSHCVDSSMQRIAKHIPNAKLIFMVREPVERIESHYVQQLSNARQVLPIDEAIRKWPEIVATSDYAVTIEIINRYHAPENIKVLFLEDYKTKRDQVHAEVLAFLGVSNDKTALAKMAEQKQLHRREDQGMDSAFLAWLRQSKHYDKINMALPRPVIEAGKKMLRRKINVSSKLNPTDRKRLENDFSKKWRDFQEVYREA